MSGPSVPHWSRWLALVLLLVLVEQAIIVGIAALDTLQRWPLVSNGQAIGNRILVRDVLP